MQMFTGVRVNCVCPANVDTPIIRNGLEDPAGNEEVKTMIRNLIEQQGGLLRCIMS